MNILIIGAGIFGTALAFNVNNNNNIFIYARDKNQVEDINTNNQNKKYFKKLKLNSNIKAINNLKEINFKIDICIISIPVNSIFNFSLQNQFIFKFIDILIFSSKGVLNKYIFLDNFIREEINKNIIIGFLAGPTFAKDIIKNEKFYFDFCLEDFQKYKCKIKKLFNNNIILKYSDNLKGIQLLSSIKNIYGILMGYLNGLNLTTSTLNGVLVNIINEIHFLFEQLNINKKIINSYSGIGDLNLTCTSLNSRNCKFGYYLSQKYNIKEAKDKVNSTIEGINSLTILNKFLKEKNLQMKYIKLTSYILDNNMYIDNKNIFEMI